MVNYLSFHDSSFGLKWQDGAKNGNRGTTIQMATVAQQFLMSTTFPAAHCGTSKSWV
jgi:hypothetical protein